MRSLVYYIAVTLDGFIADPHGDFSVFPQDPRALAELFARYPETCPVQARAALGIDAPNRRFDTVLLGRRTQQPALDAGLAQGAYPHLRQLVATHHPLPGVETLTGDLVEQVAALKRAPGADIWLCGGSQLAGSLAELIDEVQLKVYPLTLGAGIPLFTGGHPGPMQLVVSEQLPGGLLLTTYRRG